MQTNLRERHQQKKVNQLIERIELIDFDYLIEVHDNEMMKTFGNSDKVEALDESLIGTFEGEIDPKKINKLIKQGQSLEGMFPELDSALQKALQKMEKYKGRGGAEGEGVIGSIGKFGKDVWNALTAREGHVEDFAELVLGFTKGINSILEEIETQIPRDKVKSEKSIIDQIYGEEKSFTKIIRKKFNDISGKFDLKVDKLTKEILDKTVPQIEEYVNKINASGSGGDAGGGGTGGGKAGGREAQSSGSPYRESETAGDDEEEDMIIAAMQDIEGMIPAVSKRTNIDVDRLRTIVNDNKKIKKLVKKMIKKMPNLAGKISKVAKNKGVGKGKGKGKKDGEKSKSGAKSYKQQIAKIATDAGEDPDVVKNVLKQLNKMGKLLMGESYRRNILGNLVLEQQENTESLMSKLNQKFKSKKELTDFFAQNGEIAKKVGGAWQIKDKKGKWIDFPENRDEFKDTPAEAIQNLLDYVEDKGTSEEGSEGIEKVKKIIRQIDAEKIDDENQDHARNLLVSNLYNLVISTKGRPDADKIQNYRERFEKSNMMKYWKEIFPALKVMINNKEIDKQFDVSGKEDSKEDNKEDNKEDSKKQEIINAKKQIAAMAQTLIDPEKQQDAAAIEKALTVVANKLGANPRAFINLIKGEDGENQVQKFLDQQLKDPRIIEDISTLSNTIKELTSKLEQSGIEIKAAQERASKAEERASKAEGELNISKKEQEELRKLMQQDDEFIAEIAKLLNTSVESVKSFTSSKDPGSFQKLLQKIAEENPNFKANVDDVFKMKQQVQAAENDKKKMQELIDQVSNATGQKINNSEELRGALMRHSMTGRKEEIDSLRSKIEDLVGNLTTAELEKETLAGEKEALAKTLEDNKQLTDKIVQNIAKILPGKNVEQLRDLDFNDPDNIATLIDTISNNNPGAIEKMKNIVSKKKVEKLSDEVATAIRMDKETVKKIIDKIPSEMLKESAATHETLAERRIFRLIGLAA